MYLFEFCQCKPYILPVKPLNIPNLLNTFLCRNHLVQEIVRTQNELQRTKQSLYTYESVGETFTKLLNQYTQLTMEIDNKKWALAELNKSAES